MSELVLGGRVTARAQVNIALVKYWGKAPARGPDEANLPAVPSLSLTLDGLGSVTSVRFAPERTSDRVVLDGVALEGPALAQSVALLHRVRELADVASAFEVDSTNTVPTAAGLASSASGMAALAAASARCAGLDLTPEDLSEVARIGSGSAARSVFGGWAAWDGPSARSVASQDHWDVSLIVALVDAGAKPIGSRDAMIRTAQTSPLYAGWVAQAQASFDQALKALEARDLPALADAMESSTLRMHGAAMGATPPIVYWRPASLAVVEAVRAQRADHGVPCGWTMDAGPNVKVLCESGDASAIAERLGAVPGVLDVLVCRPGAGVQVEEPQAAAS